MGSVVPSRFAVLLALLFSMPAWAEGQGAGCLTQAYDQVYEQAVRGPAWRWHEIYSIPRLSEAQLGEVAPFVRAWGIARELAAGDRIVDLVFQARDQISMMEDAALPRIDPLDPSAWSQLFRTAREKATGIPGWLAPVEEPALVRGELMARFGDALLQKLGELPREERRTVEFAIADAVQGFEAFSADQYVRQEKHIAERMNGHAVGLGDFPEWARRYVNQTPEWTGINWRRIQLSILNEKSMRDLTSRNLWPVLMPEHDVRHVHYAIGHPRAAIAYFQSARSRFHTRYATLAAMFEGVDTVQFFHEQRLVSFMAREGHELEDAMLRIARAPRRELDRIIRGARISSAIRDKERVYAQWQPPENDSLPVVGLSGLGLSEDAALAFEQWIRLSEDPANRRLLNYSRKPQVGGMDEPDDSIHHP